ncbi:Hypothetical protein PBC10988_10000 [Planctomycetales bacterium 10988]|nr:Hypothetical protein PBC10988_10000 [Planctomycetales bacterium 10988]
MTPDEVSLAASKLIEVERVDAAILLLSMATHSEHPLDPECLLETLETVMKLPAPRQKELRERIDQHHIQELIGYLQNQSSGDYECRLATIEWFFLPLLGEFSIHSPKTLHSQLEKSPKFFIELLSVADHVQQEPTQEEKNRVEYAYHLLHGWKTIPGTEPDGKIQEEKLRQWCEEVRQLARKTNRLGICDSKLGELFAHAPSDPDGTWPCEAVREIVEEIGTEELGKGLYYGIVNSRGVAWGTGGEEEHELATQFRSKAEKISFDHPFVGEILENVSQCYELQANHCKEEARWEG